MVLHVSRSAFLSIHTSLIIKNCASGVGGRILRWPPRFLPTPRYALEKSPPLLVWAGPAHGLRWSALWVQLRLHLSRLKRESPAGLEEAIAVLWKGHVVREALKAQSDPSGRLVRRQEFHCTAARKQQPTIWKTLEATLPKHIEMRTSSGWHLVSAFWDPEQKALPSPLNCTHATINGYCFKPPSWCNLLCDNRKLIKAKT